MSAVHNNLIQIAASKMHKGNIIEQFDGHRSGHPLSAFTTELTGITDNHVKVLTFSASFTGVSEFCQGTVLVTHNGRP